MKSQDSMPVVATKQPMDLAALVLAELCEQVDSGADLDRELVARFDDAKLTLADAVDRRIAFDTWIKGAIEASRAARADWDQRTQLLKRIHEAFKAKTLAIVEASPDVPFVGRFGRLASQKSPPAIKLSFGDKQLTPQLIDMFGIDERFVKTVTTQTIDIDAVKAALAAGDNLPWAEQVQGTHLRIRK